MECFLEQSLIMYSSKAFQSRHRDQIKKAQQKLPQGEHNTDQHEVLKKQHTAYKTTEKGSSTKRRQNNGQTL